MSAPVLAFAPDFRLAVNGSPVPAELRATVTSVSYTDGRNAADRVEVVLTNPDLYWLRKHIRGMGFAAFPTRLPTPVETVSTTPAGVLDVDNSLSLAMGYTDSGVSHLFSGEITGINASFPNSGAPTVTIVAHDKLHRLSSGKTQRGFGLLPDFVIAAVLSAENRILPLIDPAVVGASTAIAVVKAIFSGSGRKQNASDLEFLAEIAKTYDAEFWVEDDVLYLSRFLKEYTPSATLTWGRTLMDFSPRLTTVGQVAGVSMTFTLREIPLSFAVGVFWDFDREFLGVSVLPSVAAKKTKVFSGASFSVMDKPISSPADLTSNILEIVTELRRRLNKRLTGTGSCVGDPTIRAGELIRLEGMGPDFSGDYRISTATHTLNASGYRTTFDAYKELIP